MMLYSLRTTFVAKQLFLGPLLGHSPTFSSFFSCRRERKLYSLGTYTAGTVTGTTSPQVGSHSSEWFSVLQQPHPLSQMKTLPRQICTSIEVCRNSVSAKDTKRAQQGRTHGRSGTPQESLRPWAVRARTPVQKSATVTRTANVVKHARVPTWHSCCPNTSDTVRFALLLTLFFHRAYVMSFSGKPAL